MTEAVQDVVPARVVMRHFAGDGEPQMEVLVDVPGWFSVAERLPLRTPLADESVVDEDHQSVSSRVAFTPGASTPDIFTRLGRTDHVSGGDIVAIGTWLGNRLLPPGPRSRVEALVDAGHSVELRLSLDDVSAALPWEWARFGSSFEPRTLDERGPIALVRQTDAVRRGHDLVSGRALVMDLLDTEEGGTVARLLRSAGWEVVVVSEPAGVAPAELVAGFRLVYVAGHMTPDGIERTGQRPVDRRALTSVVSAAHARVVVLNVCGTAVAAGRSSWLDEMVRTGGAAAAIGIQGEIDGYRESGPFACSIVESLLSGEPASVAASRARVATARAGFGGSSGLPVAVVGPERDVRLRPDRTDPAGTSGRGHAVLSGGRVLGMDWLTVGLEAVVSVEVEVGGAVPPGVHVVPRDLERRDEILTDFARRALEEMQGAGLPHAQRVLLVGVDHVVEECLWRRSQLAEALGAVVRTAAGRALESATGEPIHWDALGPDGADADDRDRHIAGGLGLVADGHRIVPIQPMYLILGGGGAWHPSDGNANPHAEAALRAALRRSAADFVAALRGETHRYLENSPVHETLLHAVGSEGLDRLALAAVGHDELVLGFDRPVDERSLARAFGYDAICAAVRPPPYQPT